MYYKRLVGVILFALLTQTYAGISRHRRENPDETDPNSDEKPEEEKKGCDKNCVIIIVGCVLAVFFVLLMGTLCFAMCNGTSKKKRKTSKGGTLRNTTLPPNTDTARMSPLGGESQPHVESLGGFYNKSYESDSNVSTLNKHQSEFYNTGDGYAPSLISYPEDGGNAILDEETSSEESIRRLDRNFKMTTPMTTSELFPQDKFPKRIISAPEKKVEPTKTEEEIPVKVEAEDIEIPVMIKDDDEIEIKIKGEPPAEVKQDGPRGLRKGKSRNILGSIKSMGSRKKKSLKNYGDKLVVGRSLFGFQSFKSKEAAQKYREKNQQEEEDESDDYDDPPEQIEQPPQPPPRAAPPIVPPHKSQSPPPTPQPQPTPQAPQPDQKQVVSSMTINVQRPQIRAVQPIVIQTKMSAEDDVIENNDVTDNNDVNNPADVTEAAQIPDDDVNGVNNDDVDFESKVIIINDVNENHVIENGDVKNDDVKINDDLQEDAIERKANKINNMILQLEELSKGK